MGRRPELDAPSGASMGTRAARTGRQAGREGQATGDLPLPPPGLAGGFVDGMLLGVLAWAVLTLTLLPALGRSATASTRTQMWWGPRPGQSWSLSRPTRSSSVATGRMPEEGGGFIRAP